MRPSYLLHIYYHSPHLKESVAAQKNYFYFQGKSSVLEIPNKYIMVDWVQTSLFTICLSYYLGKYGFAISSRSFNTWTGRAETPSNSILSTFAKSKIIVQ